MYDFYVLPTILFPYFSSYVYSYDDDFPLILAVVLLDTRHVSAGSHRGKSLSYGINNFNDICNYNKTFIYQCSV
jgi:hypothetical protein